MRVKMKALFLVTLFAMVSMLSSGCMTQVPPQHVAILFDGPSGKIEPITKPTGVMWVGLWQDLICFPSSIKNATYVRQKGEGEQPGADDSIQAKTLEGATLPIDLTVAWRVAPENVEMAFRALATADLETIQQNHIRYSAISATNVVTGKESIFDLISKDRSTLGPQVKAVLAPIMLEKYGITVDDVYVGEVYPDPAISAKIQETLEARTALEQKRNELKQARIEKGTVLTQARAVAAQSKLMASQGDIALKVKKLEIRREAIEKWDGVAPIVGSATVPFTNVQMK